jgi:DNA polymerase-3 subunit beta
MKFIAIHSNIREAISVVANAVGENQNLPILKNILIKANGATVSFMATNLEIAITCRVSGKVIEEGEITVPVGLLVNVINNIKSDRLNFETKGAVLEIKTDNYNATIQGLSAEDFPPAPKIKNPGSYLEIKGVFLREAIQQVDAAAQVSDLRPELSSVFFNFSIETLKLATTDGFRLSEKTIPGNSFTSKDQEPFKMLLPLKTAYEVQRIIKDDDTVQIYFDENQVLIKTSQIELISRLIEGNFPEYTQIIPKNFISEIAVNTAEFLAGIKLAAIFGQKNGEVEIRVHPAKKAVEIVSADQTLGENNYLLPAKIKGDALTVVFNWRYLTEPLKVIKTEETLFAFQEEANPALIRPASDGSYFYIIKPILRA